MGLSVSSSKSRSRTGRLVGSEVGERVFGCAVGPEEDLGVGTMEGSSVGMDVGSGIVGNIVATVVAAPEGTAEGCKDKVGSSEGAEEGLLVDAIGASVFSGVLVGSSVRALEGTAVDGTEDGKFVGS